MKVRDVYRKRSIGAICKVVGYYNGADYGFLSKYEDDCNEDILDMEVECIGVDTFNGDEHCLCVMVS